MKDKKHKYLEDLADEYIALQEEQAEILQSIEKAEKKFRQYLSPEPGPVYKMPEAEDLYKAHMAVKKQEERKSEVASDLAEVEDLLRLFLGAISGGKVSYEKKDDNDKSKITYLFWVENNQVKFLK